MYIIGTILVFYFIIIALSLIQIIRGKAKNNTRFKVFVAIEIVIFIFLADGFLKGIGIL